MDRTSLHDVSATARRVAAWLAPRVGFRRPGDERFGALHVIGWLTFVAGLAIAVIARRQAPWIPLAYLATFLVAGIALWRCFRWSGGQRVLRWGGAVAAAAVVVALVPIPWMNANLDTPPGTAWRLDGRLEINGTIADPPGEWYWLTAGRPPVVAELVASRLLPGTEAPSDLRGGRAGSQPHVSEPAAAVVGVRAAGVETPRVDAAVGGWLSRTPPGQWFRKLAVGRSHGMMVALVSYAHVSGQGFAAGRSIAGTGGINADGTVSPIGGLRSKATAARGVGADILLYPASQGVELAGFDPGTMQLIGVTSLDEAIDALTTTAVAHPPTG